MSFNTSQNIIQIDNPKHKIIDKSLKERFKIHLVLDMNNSAGANKIIMQTKNNTRKMNNMNSNNKNKNYKINLDNKNNIKLLKSNVNNNKNNRRKLTINFKNMINKKIIIKRMNIFITKDTNNISKRFKSLNPKEYTVNNNNSKQKNIMNGNKPKNNNNNENKNNLFEKILKENNNMNFKNVALLKSKLPKLNVNKT